MKKSIITILVAIVTIATSAYPQVDSTTIGGYVMTQAPTNAGENSFTNRWAVVKATGYADGTKVSFQYDVVSQCVVEAQGTRSFALGTGNLDVFAGATFTAAGQITPAPDGLTTEWWHEVFMNYSFLGNGVGLAYTNGDFAGYAVRTDVLSIAATCHGLQGLWQEGFGGTIAYDGQLHRLLNPFLGVTFFNDCGDNQYSFMNTVFVDDNLGIYWGGDAGRIEEARIGGYWDYNPNIRLKAAYSVKAEKSFVEVVCHF